MSWLEDYGAWEDDEVRPIVLRPVSADLDAWVKYIEEGHRANQMPETTDIWFTEVTHGVVKADA